MRGGYNCPFYCNWHEPPRCRRRHITQRRPASLTPSSTPARPSRRNRSERRRPVATAAAKGTACVVCLICFVIVKNNDTTDDE